MKTRRFLSTLGYTAALIRDGIAYLRTPRWIRELEEAPEGVNPDEPPTKRRKLPAEVVTD